MNPNLLASTTSEKVLYCQEKMAFYSNKTWDIYVYIMCIYILTKEENTKTSDTGS